MTKHFDLVVKLIRQNSCGNKVLPICPGWTPEIRMAPAGFEPATHRL